MKQLMMVDSVKISNKQMSKNLTENFKKDSVSWRKLLTYN